MTKAHRLSEVDPVTRTAVCEVDGPVAIYRNGTKASGGPRFRCYVSVKAREGRRPPRERTLRYSSREAVADRLLAGICERCGFVAEDLCQLDVDHIVRRVDGGSDDPENLAVLCANCHRVKTRLERLPEFNYALFMAI